VLVPLQVSVVHALPSSVHAVPLVFFASLGQLPLVPEHVSATSHSPADARQTVLADRNLSTGQSLLAPSQLSAVSQAPAEARQTAVLFASVGHVVDVPVQVSAMSQTPAAARQTAPALPAGC
jgi:hypothetical protein